MPRLIVVANRLPVSAASHRSGLRPEYSTRDLALGVDPSRCGHPSIWISESGDTELWSASSQELNSYCEEFLHACLWPVYHSLPSLIPLELTGWQEYEQGNQRFAEAVVNLYRRGDRIWIHDLHLSLVPAMLRKRLSRACIGYFLHSPFPPSEIFRILPQRAELLRGMLGADVIGFNTSTYARNFATSVRRILGPNVEGPVVKVDGRQVVFGSYPSGIDIEAFSRPVCPKSSNPILAIRQVNPTARLLLAIDLLDYTSGITHRLLAFERLLEKRRELLGQVIFLQGAVPLRSGSETYKENKRSVEEIVGRINGRFGTPGYHPVHYFSTAYIRDELIHLYRGVDVMVATPLSDGMNLVAKEFCASRIDHLGVLVLSEFAGAAVEMKEALLINPYDLDQTATAYAVGLQMSQEEAGGRMLALRARLKKQDCKVWAQDFLTTMEEHSQERSIAPLRSRSQRTDPTSRPCPFDGKTQKLR